jgi:hypothetical protein
MGITVDLDKAKDIAKQKIRKYREVDFPKQDALYMKALEKGEDTTAIVTEKNRLRDLTKAVDGCESTDELKELPFVTDPRPEDFKP